MITDAQGKAIRNTELMDMPVGTVFCVFNIHPDRTAQGNGKRRALRSLVKKGLLVRCNEFGDTQRDGPYYAVEGNLRMAYDTWYAKRGFNVV